MVQSSNQREEKKKRMEAELSLSYYTGDWTGGRLVATLLVSSPLLFSPDLSHTKERKGKERGEGEGIPLD